MPSPSPPADSDIERANVGEWAVGWRIRGGRRGARERKRVNERERAKESESDRARERERESVAPYRRRASQHIAGGGGGGGVPTVYTETKVSVR